MAITVEWDDDLHTIIRMTAQDAWDLAELRRTSQQAIALIRTVPHIVYVLSDYSQTRSIPLGILWEMRHLNKMIPPNWGGSVGITRDSVASTLLATLSQIYLERGKKRLSAAKSVAEAYEIIARWKREDSSAKD